MQIGSHVYLIGESDFLTWVTPELIGTSLGRINRYAGNTRVPYSVAQHSLHVADIIYRGTKDPWLSIYGLMHDAGEMVTGDIPTPVKASLSALAADELAAIEEAALACFHKSLGIPWPPSPNAMLTIKSADHIALATERRDMVPKCIQDWGLLARPDPGIELAPQDHVDVGEAWARSFHAYRGLI